MRCVIVGKGIGVGVPRNLAIQPGIDGRGTSAKPSEAVGQGSRKLRIRASESLRAGRVGPAHFATAMTDGSGARHARRIVDISTGQVGDTDSAPQLSPRSRRAAKAATAPAQKLSPKQRRAIARKAARKRWQGR
jgi:hypothetical protein